MSLIKSIGNSLRNAFYNMTHPQESFVVEFDDANKTRFFAPYGVSATEWQAIIREKLGEKDVQTHQDISGVHLACMMAFQDMEETMPHLSVQERLAKLRNDTLDIDKSGTLPFGLFAPAALSPPDRK